MQWINLIRGRENRYNFASKFITLLYNLLRMFCLDFPKYILQYAVPLKRYLLSSFDSRKCLHQIKPIS